MPPAQAWYCSDLCARGDWASHKQLCQHATRGRWAPAGTRPSCDYWAASAGQAAARRLLRRCSGKPDGLAASELPEALHALERRVKQVGVLVAWAGGWRQQRRLRSQLSTPAPVSALLHMEEPH